MTSRQRRIYSQNIVDTISSLDNDSSSITGQTENSMNDLTDSSKDDFIVREKLVSILKAHDWKIKSVVPLQNSMFITCSFEAKLKLWDNTSLKKEFGDNNIFVSMIKLRKQNVLVCSECTYNELYRNKENYKIVFYSLDNFDIVHQILKIEKNHKNGLKETNNNKLIIIGEHVITIVNSIHYQIELKIQLNESNNKLCTLI